MTENKTHYKMYKSHKNWVIAGITVCGGILAAQNMNTNIAKADSINSVQNNTSESSSNITTSSDLSKQSSNNSNSSNNSTQIKQTNVSSNGINTPKDNNEESNLSVNIKSDNQNINDNVNLNSSVTNNRVDSTSTQNINSNNSSNTNKTNSQAEDFNANKSVVNNQAENSSSNKLVQNSSANSNNISTNKVDENTTANNQTINNSASQSTAKNDSNNDKVADNIYDAASNNLSSDEKANLSPNGDISDEQGTKYISKEAGQPVSFAAVNSNVNGLSFAAQVVPSKSLGVDVSGYQGTDMSGYARNGAKFAIVKVSEGTGYGNRNASGQIKSALANGMEVQGYHFAHFGGSISQADAEATHAIANAEYYGLPKGSYLACDYEADASGSVANNTAAVEEFMKKIKDAGYTPLLYSGAYYMKQHLNTNDIVNKFGNCLWVASYPTTSAVNGPDFNYFPSMNGVIMWQYSDNWKGMNVDGDVNVIPLTGNQQGGQSNPQPSHPAQTGSSSSSSSSNNNYKQDYKVGDKVTINKNASKWTNGSTINHAVTDGQVYTVQQVATGNGGAVLLGASDGTTMGWVNDWDVSPVTNNNTSNEPTWTDNLGDVWHKESGIFTVGDSPINLRWGATTSSTIITQLQPGQQVQYDAWMNDGTYTWIRQPRADGSYAYCAVRDKDGAFGTFSDVPNNNTNNSKPNTSTNKPSTNKPTSTPNNPDAHYTGQKQVNGKWQYWNNGQPVKNNYVWIPDEKKECYYDGNGNMVYGQQNINGHWQYFDPTTGAQVKNNYVWLPDDKKEVYYDGNGNMVYGWQNIWGHKVYFDTTTGAQYKNCDKVIDGQNWHFDKDGNATLVQNTTNSSSNNNSSSSNANNNSNNSSNNQQSQNKPTNNGSSSNTNDNSNSSSNNQQGHNKPTNNGSSSNANNNSNNSQQGQNKPANNGSSSNINNSSNSQIGGTTQDNKQNSSSSQPNDNKQVNNSNGTTGNPSISGSTTGVTQNGNSGSATNTDSSEDVTTNNKGSNNNEINTDNKENASSSNDSNKEQSSGINTPSSNNSNESNINSNNSDELKQNEQIKADSSKDNSAGDIDADKLTANNVVEDNGANENSIVGNEDISSKNESTNKYAVNINASQSPANNNNKSSNADNNDQHYMGEELDRNKLVESAQEDYIKNQQKANEGVTIANSQIGSSSNISNENSNVIPQTGEANNDDKEKGIIMLASAGLIGMLGVSTLIKKKED